MKKVLFVVHTLQMGGAEKVLLNLLKNINKEKYEITVLAIVDDGIYIEELKKIQPIQYRSIFPAFFKESRANKEAKYHKLSNKVMSMIWKWYIRMMKYFPRMVYRMGVKEKYDIEIAFLEGKVAKVVAHSTNPNSQKIVWIHTDIHNVSGIPIFKNAKDEKKTYQAFQKIVCVSNDVKQQFMKKTGIKDHIFVQVNPIDSSDILEKAEEELPPEYQTDQTVVISVGRLVKEKGYDRLLEVHKRLCEEGLIHEVWIVGEGREREGLEEYILQNHLEKTVRLVGYSSNPYCYVNRADIFVCSSRVEGLSSAVLEATILEKPIVSTQCPGASDILGENGEAAIIVENSTEGIYEGLKQLLASKELREEYKEKIKKRSRLFEIQHAISDIEKIIDC